MKYDFDRITDRRGSDSIKWRVPEGELPMWVADMDFETAPCIKEAIVERASHGIFGYGDIPEEWYDAYSDWWGTRHGYKIDKKNLIFCTGVIPAISSAVRKLTTPAENVVIMTPVYHIFYNCILNNGRKVLENKLKYENGEYSIDFDDLEKKLSDSQTTMLLLCNPQNPAGKIWNREELAKIGALACRNGVTVISDEIHCDITAPGKGYIPFASASEECESCSITCVSPTKTFNLAGIQSAAVFSANPQLRHRIRRALNTDEVAEPNSFAVLAAISAFREGGEWLDKLREYVHENKKYLSGFISENIPEISAPVSDATYLAWANISGIGYDGDFQKYLRKEFKLYVSPGKVFGGNGGDFVRINLACPRSYVEEGAKRLLACAESLR